MKLIITEEQYRLLKEEDYGNVVDLLMSDNQELALYLIKGQELDIDTVVSKILQKKNITSFEDLDAILKSRNGTIFLPIKLLNSYIALYANIEKSGYHGYRYHDLKFKIYRKKDGGEGQEYKRSLLIYSSEPEAEVASEEEYFEFLEDILKTLSEFIGEAIKNEINNLPEETE
jgi:hypothetical protein